MTSRFDLFREESNGTVQWLCVVSDEKAGKQRARSEPGKYFIFDQAKAQGTYIEPTPLPNSPCRT
jgi:hypothetical protein